MTGRQVAEIGKYYTSQELMKHDAPVGYWWENVAKVDEPQRWMVRVAPHESTLLFGYEPDELMSKQYRTEPR